MRSSFMALGAAIGLLISPADKNGPPPAALNAIRPSDIRQHVEYLAADDMRGRNTPSPELNRAAAYIADQFKAAGLSPVRSSYFHEFEVTRVRLGTKNELRIAARGQENSYQIKTEFMPFDMTASKLVEAELVFAGYGITAPEHHYDDYQGIDTRGKIVLVMRHVPAEKNTQGVFAGKQLTDYGQVQTKVENAIAHGAAGVLVVTDPLNHRNLRPRGFSWPSLFESIPNDAIPLSLALTEHEKVPVVQIGETAIEQLFGSVDSLRTLQQRIDTQLQPQSGMLAGVRVRLQTTTISDPETVKNVVGFIEGADAGLKQEIVVIGAHYDHVGALKEHQPGEDYIYNGADDNASGTSLVLALASAFGHSPVKPRRSVLLIAFAGEEKGLFGSRAYVETPLFPLQNTVAMLNFDMVGRNAADSVSVGGRKQSPELFAINAAENRYVGLKIDDSIDEFFNRSDQYNFAKKHVPFLFYFTGLHKDYHQPGDEAEKINAGKIAMIGKLGFRVAWHIANSSRRFPYVDK